MIRLITFLLSGCWHRWEIIAQGPAIRRNDVGDVTASGTFYTLQCQRCGALKQKDWL